VFPHEAPPLGRLLMEIWAPGIWVFMTSLLLSLLATPVFRWVAKRFGIVDQPDHAVKIHARPIPYLGGCAIWLAWTVPMVVHLVFGHPGHVWAELMLIVGGVVAFGTGLVDDLLDIPPKWKLFGQAVAGAILLVGGIMWFAYPALGFFPFDLPQNSWFVLVVCVGMHFFVVLGVTNATNLLDGLDGLCSGVTAIIAVGFLMLATSLTAYYLYGTGLKYEYTTLIMLVAFALAGAAIGFLPYNFNPARIFMGDAGSIFVGYVLAAMMIMFASKFGMVKWFVGALFIFGLPIFDTAMALIRRVSNRRPVMMPDCSHLYNQLVDRLGLTVRQTVGVSYGLSVLFAVLGLLVVYEGIRGRWAAGMYLVLGVGFLVIVWLLGFFQMTPEEKAAADRYLARKGRA